MATEEKRGRDVAKRRTKFDIKIADMEARGYVIAECLPSAKIALMRLLDAGTFITVVRGDVHHGIGKFIKMRGKYA